MKNKYIFIGLVLCCFSVFAMFGIAGCGEVSLQNLKDNFAAFDSTFDSLSQSDSAVFKQDSIFGLESKFVVSGYGSYVDNQIASGQTDYAELSSLYNVMLVLSSDYVESYRALVFALDETTLSAQSKSALKDLNGSLVDYTNYVKEFVEAREALMDHFSKFAEKDARSDAASLLRFKKVYGTLVEKNIQLSTNMAKMVESTKILDTLQGTTPTTEDAKTVKEYLAVKMLPIYSNFKITEISNKMNWNAQKNTETKTRINALIARVDANFEQFINNFLSKSVKDEAPSVEEFKLLFDWAEDFCVEADSYFQALYGLNLSNLAVNFDNNMNNYLKTNQLAEVYLQKLEQFVDVTLPNFMNAVSEKLLQDN